MENEKLIEVIKAQNDLITLLINDSGIARRKPQEERLRINILLNVLRDFNKNIPQ